MSNIYPILDEKEWTSMLEHQHSLYKEFDDKQYWHDNYIKWGDNGNFINEIYKRRGAVEETTKHIFELECGLIDIVDNLLTKIKRK
jgi:hypothetical protein